MQHITKLTSEEYAANEGGTGRRVAEVGRNGVEGGGKEELLEMECPLGRVKDAAEQLYLPRKAVGLDAGICSPGSGSADILRGRGGQANITVLPEIVGEPLEVMRSSANRRELTTPPPPVWQDHSSTKKERPARTRTVNNAEMGNIAEYAPIALEGPVTTCISIAVTSTAMERQRGMKEQDRRKERESASYGSPGQQMAANPRSLSRSTRGIEASRREQRAEKEAPTPGVDYNTRKEGPEWRLAIWSRQVKREEEWRPQRDDADI
ncbi:hypothetical protein BXZ70DRAFT_904345 [Cristinia sonorae]|uniref:Uncharacterized protein n=1 Tax=Cristinia sonorae TaxID=1940300 RepID=A0A8K0UUI0_9AGAR|nr:hypothetical protein BXZ70DRAFT_904345 [Cristinia sonorae]